MYQGWTLVGPCRDINFMYTGIQYIGIIAQICIGLCAINDMIYMDKIATVFIPGEDS